MFDYSTHAEKQIREDKLKMCINQLFRDVNFDKNVRKIIIYIKKSNTKFS